ncbi:TPA: CoA protein activase [Candidatus Avigastranaerophilus faecigallinarum]|nr:CoA protein activase [Candidatus Avigastranaerophilus faecigallinarum]
MKNKTPIKVAFPHMGNVYIAWSAALKKLGIEPFIPPHTSKKTLEVAAKYSPESICLPYKMVLGNFLQAIEKGADYVAMISSPGICRLGEYGQSIKNVLKDLGYEDKYTELQLYDGFKGMYTFLTQLSGVKNPVILAKAINIAVRKVFVLDRIENLFSYYRAREIVTGTAEKHYNRALSLIIEANNTKELKAFEKEAIEEIKKTEIDVNRDVLTVDITGEIFLVQEPFSNQNIEKELGRMGVQTRRSLTVSGFIKDAIIPKAFKKGETHLERAYRMARPYLMRDIGGDALESVSDVAYANERGVDGIIHVSPFTCMPEIMSQNIFPTMRENCEIPILTLILDEQTGRAGYITRLEAFVDLMRRRKMYKKKQQEAAV